MSLPSSQMRAKIACHLPKAFDAAICSYQSFYDTALYDDAKSFSAHHSACKAAIAHLQLLIKLADWVEADTPEDDLELFQSAKKLAQDELSKTDVMPSDE